VEVLSLIFDVPRIQECGLALLAAHWKPVGYSQVSESIWAIIIFHLEMSYTHSAAIWLQFSWPGRFSRPNYMTTHAGVHVMIARRFLIESKFSYHSHHGTLLQLGLLKPIIAMLCIATSTGLALATGTSSSEVSSCPSSPSHIPFLQISAPTITKGKCQMLAQNNLLAEPLEPGFLHKPTASFVIQTLKTVLIAGHVT